MHIFTHAFISWNAAACLFDNKRDRIFVTVAGIVPDVDGLGAIPQVLSGGRLPWYDYVHHTIGHNLWFALLYGIFGFFFCKKRWRPALFAFFIMHLHFLCDILGSGGPDGSIWPLYYLWPLDQLTIIWQHQWMLHTWPNITITLVAMAWMFWFARKNGFSILEMISQKADALFVTTLRKRLK